MAAKWLDFDILETDVVKSDQANGSSGALAVVITKRVRLKVGLKAGEKLRISHDKKGRLIYRRL